MNRVVSHETTYAQKPKTDSENCIYINVCIHIHTYVCMHITITAKKKEVINLRRRAVEVFEGE